MILLKLSSRTVSTLCRSSSSSQTSCLGGGGGALWAFQASVQVFPAERQPSRTVTDGSARYMNAVRNVAFVSERWSGEGK